MAKNRQRPPRKNRSTSSIAKQDSSFPIVGIGASAGGLEAFSELLRHLPEKSGMSFVLVQHLDPSHGSTLHDILARTTRIPVIEAVNGTKVEVDHVYVMPANADIVLDGGVLRLGPREFVRGQNMPIDTFFESLAEERRERAVGVILSGTASDGTEGCTAIKAAGGITFAQDDMTAKFNSMPRSAAHSGCVDFVLPPKKIALELARIGRHPYIAAAATEDGQDLPAGSELDTLLRMLGDATGVDFANYKHSTLRRRIKRRMVLHRIEKLKEYLAFIKKNSNELDELYRDILIHVTGFFRDPDAFAALRNQVFPALFQRQRTPDEGPVRIWVPGCSTGEEAYSIAISVLEYLWEQKRSTPFSVATKVVQIFATDISDSALDRARTGLYMEAALSDVSEERRKRFFVKLDGGYQISKPIRDMCIFAKQNLAKDPPFSNLDLISCRNLLIYLGPVLQKRVIPTMHYALKPHGYLMLGGSESLGTFGDHFTLVDKKYKIYQKKRSSTRLITYFTGLDFGTRRPSEPATAKLPQRGLSVEQEVERILVNRFVPASIVVNDEMDIVQFRGKTGAYLEPAAGHPSFSLSRMAREGLLVDLRAALTRARKQNTTVRTEGLQVKNNGNTREVNLEVIPIRQQGSGERFYVVVFQDAESAPSQPAARRRPEPSRQKQSALTRSNDQLTRETAQLREQLKSLIEEHETTLEEFKSANEEVLSANEELQSTNEELETAKEELQSSNEELTTLNEELQNRNLELSTANNDLVNLLANVSIPVVMVDNDLRIRRFTPQAEKLMNLIPADIGRRLGEIRSNLTFDELEQVARETIDTTTLQEREVQEKSGRWHVMRVRPYKTWENRIDGAVIAFQDIDALKRTLDQTRSYADALIESAREPILVLDGDLRVSTANQAFYKSFDLTPGKTISRLITEVGEGQWNIPKLRKLLQDVTPHNSRVDDFEVQHRFAKLGSRIMILNARRIEAQPGNPMVLLSIEDVTQQRKQIEDLRLYAGLVELATETVIVRDLGGTIHFWNRGAEDMYGWTKEEAVGKITGDLLQTKYPKPIEEIKAELTSTGYWEGQLVHTRRDGAERIVRSRWAMRKEGQEELILEINSDITNQKKSEDNLRQLSAYLIRVQDEERRRMARDLHDSTGQALVAIGMNLQRLVDGPADKGLVSKTLELCQGATQEIRSISQLLHPPMLDEAGLVSAARWLVEGFSGRNGIKVDLAVSSDIGRFDTGAETALFRVLQESLNNIRKHSGATKVRVEITAANSSIQLKVIDNGKGMPSEAKSNGEGVTQLGVGILGMRERLYQLKGTLDIQSGKKGTTIVASVPAKLG